MLTLGQIIRAQKVVTDLGSWKTGKIPASAFPIAKQKRFPQSSAWQWRVIQFTALEYHCRLLIRLNTEIEYYSSILSINSNQLIQIICHHEIHLSHKNWHCHFVPGDVRQTHPGVLRDRDRMRSFEAEPSKLAERIFEINEHQALAIAAKRFRIQAPDETPPQGELRWG